MKPHAQRPRQRHRRKRVARRLGSIAIMQRRPCPLLELPGKRELGSVEFVFGAHALRLRNALLARSDEQACEERDA